MSGSSGGRGRGAVAGTMLITVGAPIGGIVAKSTRPSVLMYGVAVRMPVVVSPRYVRGCAAAGLVDDGTTAPVVVAKGTLPETGVGSSINTVPNVPPGVGRMVSVLMVLPG